MTTELSGKQVMVVEDEMLVALLVEETLADAGCTVIGPFARVQDALAAAQHHQLDLALLDVNVAGETSFPIAQALEARGVPFLFVTGYGKSALPQDRPDWDAVVKPFIPEHLTERLARLLRAA